MEEVVVTLDCLDINTLADFWEAALAPMAYRRAFEAPPYLELASTQGPNLLLQQVPEGRQVKNRMHLDLRVRDLDAEVRRLHQVGAKTVAADLTEHAYRWTVLADPEGNEFCLFVEPSRRK